MQKITFVAATGNADKLEEMRSILGCIGCSLITKNEAGILVEPDETGATFLENALIKARAVRQACGRPVISDDSGLVVDALGGAPGVRSARYAGEPSDAGRNIDKLLEQLSGVGMQERTARFVSVVCAILSDDTELFATGVCEGIIGTYRKGDNGFGYDPVFWMRGYRSMAQLSQEQKNRISHRGRAVRKLAFLLRGIKSIRGNWL